MADKDDGYLPKINRYVLRIENIWDDDHAYQRVLKGDHDHSHIGSITAALHDLLRRSPSVPPAVAAASALLDSVLDASHQKGTAKDRQAAILKALNLGKASQDTHVRNSVIADTVRELRKRGMTKADACELVAATVYRSVNRVEGIVETMKNVPNASGRLDDEMLIERLKRYR